MVRMYYNTGPRNMRNIHLLMLKNVAKHCHLKSYQMHSFSQLEGIRLPL